uniref:GH16 domain-containing protein n=1 Tax=Strigamia maritima TaxID=126957 RepID=T1ILI4_STRMM
MRFFFRVSFLVIIHDCLFESKSDYWQLVWDDEFEGPLIDTNRWNFEIGDGCKYGICKWGNDEQQLYTDSIDNAFISDGKLIIQAQHIDNQYTSARMITKGKGDWKFGKIEIRAKFPSGEGLLANIWLLPTYSRYGLWPASGEVDIAARFGEKTGRSVSTIAHYGAVYPDHRHSRRDYTVNYPQPSFTEEFYTFTFEWEENKMQWFINNVKVNELAGDETFPSKYIFPFNEKFHLTLSIAVGGRPVFGNILETVFPQRLEIDYIRVYQKK